MDFFFQISNAKYTASKRSVFAKDNARSRDKNEATSEQVLRCLAFIFQFLLKHQI